ncbi:hypothetical protein Dsin_032214 [Dipteronia sinensis]|uniref:DUF1985 domain-containing protein n=1 Tax=Dipteronia sinensis TaxID=43782 RepID=A0AAD9ZMM8_9ROSI|nr:hypothetical protein Dsin_032214 [Dipteronia sinensis]
MKFFGGVMHLLLLRELHHDGPTDEMRFMLANQCVRFSRVEFCLITGLKFGAIPDTDVYDEYFGGRDVVTFSELEARSQQGQWEQPFDAVKLCLLLMVNCVIHRLDERHYIPIWQVRLVEDLDAFNAFPWGLYVYKTSIFAFKKALHKKKNRYNIFGFAYALLMFAEAELTHTEAGRGQWYYDPPSSYPTAVRPTRVPLVADTKIVRPYKTLATSTPFVGVEATYTWHAREGTKGHT